MRRLHAAPALSRWLRTRLMAHLGGTSPLSVMLQTPAYASSDDISAWGPAPDAHKDLAFGVNREWTAKSVLMAMGFPIPASGFALPESGVASPFASRVSNAMEGGRIWPDLGTASSRVNGQPSPLSRFSPMMRCCVF